MNHYLILRTQKMVTVCDGLCDGGVEMTSLHTQGLLMMRKDMGHWIKES